MLKSAAKIQNKFVYLKYIKLKKLNRVYLQKKMNDG